jgi:hypothetical protein
MPVRPFLRPSLHTPCPSPSPSSTRLTIYKPPNSALLQAATRRSPSQSPARRACETVSPPRATGRAIVPCSCALAHMQRLLSNAVLHAKSSRYSHFISACVSRFDLIAASRFDRRDILTMSNEPHRCTSEPCLEQLDLLDTIAAHGCQPAVPFARLQRDATRTRCTLPRDMRRLSRS